MRERLRERLPAARSVAAGWAGCGRRSSSTPRGPESGVIVLCLLDSAPDNEVLYSSIVYGHDFFRAIQFH